VSQRPRQSIRRVQLKSTPPNHGSTCFSSEHLNQNSAKRPSLRFVCLRRVNRHSRNYIQWTLFSHQRPTQSNESRAINLGMGLRRRSLSSTSGLGQRSPACPLFPPRETNRGNPDADHRETRRSLEELTKPAVWSRGHASENLRDLFLGRTRKDVTRVRKVLRGPLQGRIARLFQSSFVLRAFRRHRTRF
jgi:hypothetical protein